MAAAAAATAEESPIMALPDYSNLYGFALIRKNPSSGEEWHVAWLNTASDLSLIHI